jgi:hypothetical protein
LRFRQVKGEIYICDTTDSHEFLFLGHALRKGKRVHVFSIGLITHIFFLKRRGKRLAAPIYIRLESKEMDNTKPKQLEGR